MDISNWKELGIAALVIGGGIYIISSMKNRYVLPTISADFASQSIDLKILDPDTVNPHEMEEPDANKEGVESWLEGTIGHIEQRLEDFFWPPQPKDSYGVYSIYDDYQQAEHRNITI